jgi:diguanylate cyclase (GGDEF)-like protein/PAS domain S-box-containing protein
MPGDDELNFRFLAENSADVICSVGPTKELRYVSPSAFHVLGWKPEELVGKGPEALLLAEDLPILMAAIDHDVSTGRSGPPVAVRVRKKDGSVVWVEISASATTGGPREIVIVMRDINERKILEERLSTLALTDGLTGLWNRRAFDEALEREWLRTLREGSELSLLMLDIDHFKEFNDRYGHLVGDDCLRAVAVAARGTIRRTDIACRYGGEEVTVILPATEAAGAAATAEAMRAAIESLRLPHEGNPQGGAWLTVSIGVATALARSGGSMRMPESLLSAADNALYKAKKAGRNRIATALLIAPKDG